MNIFLTIIFVTDTLCYQIENFIMPGNREYWAKAKQAKEKHL